MRRYGMLVLLYIGVGIVFAVVRDQLTTPLLRDLVEVLLYILLWPLAAFGLINLNL